MPIKYHGNALEILLKQCYTTSYCQRSIRRRAFASTTAAADINNDEVSNIAVLGGGITGLASAFYLSKELPNARITLYEGSSRLGGWLHSKQINVGDGQVVFEQGPRTLRPSIPNGLVTLELVRQLDLIDEVLTTSKDSFAAQNRFLYYPDHLVRMPGPGTSIWQIILMLLGEPVFKGVLPGCLGEPLKERRPSNLQDESVGSFLSRRFGSPIADNIVSAVLHGIYAGDVYQLSVKSLLPKMWFFEGQESSVAEGLLKSWSEGAQPTPPEDMIVLEDLRKKLFDSESKPMPGVERLQEIQKSSVFTFKKGIGQLADRLESVLEANPNVQIKKDTRVDSLSLVQDEADPQIQVTPVSNKTSSFEPHNHTFTHVISTLSGKTLNAITQPTNSLSPLAVTPAVTVMVVNLFYSNPSLLPVHGFGYLLPRSLPFDQNPERALGVVFDSDATIGQDNVPGTKVTVMLGGHWWDGWDSYPDEEEGAYMAKAILARHLRIGEEPNVVRVGLQKECIPQYTVGHSDRMRETSAMLESKFKGRLRVAGNSYTGVGLNDCVRAARDVAMGLVRGERKTGLEAFVGEEKWVKQDPRKTLEWWHGTKS